MIKKLTYLILSVISMGIALISFVAIIDLAANTIPFCGLPSNPYVYITLIIMLLSNIIITSLIVDKLISLD